MKSEDDNTTQPDAAAPAQDPGPAEANAAGDEPMATQEPDAATEHKLKDDEQKVAAAKETPEVEKDDGLRRSTRRGTPKTYSERQMLKIAIEESRKEAELEQSKRRKRASSEGADKMLKSTRVKKRLSTDTAQQPSPKRRVRPTSKPKEAPEPEEEQPKQPPKWRTTGSDLIGQKCRRAIPPQFYHLVPSDLTIKATLEGSTSANTASIRLADGVVTAWKEAHDRTPTLYRIVYPLPPHAIGTNQSAFEENLTSNELVAALASAAKRQNSSLSTEQIAKEQEKIVYYGKAIGRLVADAVQKALVQLLPQLIVAAMQELTLEKCVQNYIAEEVASSTSGGDVNLLELSQPQYGSYLPYTQMYKAFRRASSAAGSVTFADGGEGVGVSTSFASSSASGGGSGVRSLSFAGSAIGQRIRQGAAMAHEALRRFGAANGVLDCLNVFEPGGRVASCIIRWGLSQEDEEASKSTFSSVDAFHLAEAIKHVPAKDIQTAALETLILTTGRKGTMKKKEGEQDSSRMSIPPYRLECTAGDAEHDFSRARYALLSIGKITEKDETVAIEDSLSDEAREARETQLKQQHDFQQRLQKRVLDLQSADGYTCFWPKWSEDALFRIKERESTAKSASEQLEQETSGETSLATAPDSAATSLSVPATQTVQDDEGLAKAIAESEETANTTSRRSRRTRASGEGSGVGIMFYASASGLTQIQVRDSLHRLIMQCYPSFLTFLDMKRLLMNENDMMGSNYREMRKIRSSLLKLLYELGKVARVYVTNEGEYNISLTQLIGSVPTSLPASNSHSGENQKQASVTARSEDPAAPCITYLQELYETERALRSLVIYVLQLSAKSIAGSADEDAGSQAGEDDEDTEQGKEQTDHPWIGKCILRPDGSRWRVASFTPSVLLEPDEGVSGSGALTTASKDQSGAALPTNTVVKRRCRFHLIPWVGDFDSEQPSLIEAAKGGGQHMILTEAQVNAGMDAVELKLALRRMRAFTVGNRHFRSHHPMKNRLNSHLTLTVEYSDSTDGAQLTKTYYMRGKVVGYNSNVDPPRILILPQSQSEDTVSKPNGGGTGAASGRTTEDLAAQVVNMDYDTLLSSLDRDSLSDLDFTVNDNVASGATTAQHSSPNAFWGTLTDNGTAVEFNPDHLEANGKSQYTSSKARIVNWLDSSNPSMDASKSLLNWLKSHHKAAAFLHKVDPVALGLPDYFNVVKNPMDLGTLEANLMQGLYSDVDGNVSLEENIDGTPSFRSDLNLVFDNAMLFNAEGSWIHRDAAWLKKNVSKRLDSEIAKLENSGRYSKHETMYDDGNEFQVQDDDEYVYNPEDDEDDDSYQGTSKRRRAAARGRSINAIDVATNDVIEKSSRITEIMGSKSFSSLSSFLDTDASTFSLPEDWLCRRRPVSANTPKEKSSVANSAGAVARVLHQLMQTPSLQSQRRSTRAGTSSFQPKGKDDVEDDNFVLEYFLRSEPNVSGINRTQVELIRESFHEYFADVHRDLKATQAKAPVVDEGTGSNGAGALHHSSSRNISSAHDGYNKNIFPPYLGHVCLATGKWEIRPHLVTPALRWVLRGLIQSGHVGCESEGNVPLTGTSTVTLSNAYYWNKYIRPFDIIEVAKKVQQKEESESEEELELSEYEKARMERVARNQERLKLLGLA